MISPAVVALLSSEACCVYHNQSTLLLIQSLRQLLVLVRVHMQVCMIDTEASVSLYMLAAHHYSMLCV